MLFRSSQREIAQKLGISENTVENHIAKALSQSANAQVGQPYIHDPSTKWNVMVSIIHLEPAGEV